MDTLLLARLQFATTTSIHFLFVAVTLGLVTLLVGHADRLGGHRQAECRSG